jgi:hypothetical protein
MMEKLGRSFEGNYWAPETSTFSTHQTLKFVLFVCVCLFVGKERTGRALRCWLGFRAHDCESAGFCLPTCLPAPWNPLAERKAGRKTKCAHECTHSLPIFLAPYQAWFPIKFPNSSHPIPLVPTNNPSRSFCSHQVPKPFPSNPSCSYQ